MGADWRGTGSSISELLSSLHKEQPSIRDSFTDVTIILPDQTLVRAHKFVLVLASPRFEAHFYGPWAEEANAETFMVNDVSSQTFRNFLDFIYNSGKMETLGISDYWSLLEAGHLYIHKGLIKHCTKKLSKHIKKLDASEDTVNFINRAVYLSIYDDLVNVATKSVLHKFTYYFQDGLIEKLNQKSLDWIKKELSTSSWVGEAGDCLFIQLNLVLHYNYFPDELDDVINYCKKKLLFYLESKSSKKKFLQLIEDNLVCAGDDSYMDNLDDQVMERLRDHLQSQSWEKLCDNGDAFINILEFLSEEEDIEGELYFDDLLELDDEDAIDWHGKVSHMYKDENSWWNLLFYARSAKLTNLEEYCRDTLLACIFMAHLNKDDLILHMNRSSEYAEDIKLFKLAIFVFLDENTWDRYSQKENWVTLNEGAIIGIRDNFEKFSHITNEEVLENVFHWCKENSENTSEAKERFLTILGPGLI